MNAVQNFAFDEHLVRIVDIDEEPWFVGRDVCGVLDIRDHKQALEALDEDERGRYTIPTPSTSDRGGGPQEVIIITEAGVYRLVFRSRKPEAERFKRWLAHEVLPQIRKTGAYSAAAQPDVPIIGVDAPLAARVDAVRLCRALFGRDRARALWSQMGLPAVPSAPEHYGIGETATLMRMIRDHVLDGETVRTLVLDAIEGGIEAQLSLANFGIKVREGDEGFLLGHRAPGVLRLFASTLYRDGSWIFPLRRLGGAKAGERISCGGVQTRSTWFPLQVFDDWAGTGL